MKARFVAVLCLPTLLFAAAPNLKVDANLRTRWESREQTYTFNRSVSSVTDDAWWLTRVRVGLKADWAPEWNAYVQLQDARELGSDRPSVPFISGSEGDDPLDFRQAYVERKSETSVWRIGRQLLALGDERLVGVSEWSNFARSFDAARLTLPKIGSGLDVFVSSVVQTQPGGSTGWHSNHSSHHDVFAGIYSRFAPTPTLKVEPYLFWRNSRKDVIYSAGAAGTSRPLDVPQRITTLGVRIVGGPSDKLHGFDYDAEFAAQTGETRGRQLVGSALAYPGPAWLDHEAWAAHAGVGYSCNVGGLPFRLYAEVNRATGDRDPTDQKNHSFFNLFPGNHAPYGTMDVFAWKNMREADFIATTTVCGFKAKLEQHWFALDNVNDTWFRSNGVTTVRPLTAAARQAPRRAGSETDLSATRSLSKQVTLDFGGSYFAAGPYLAATGGATDARVVYVQMTLQW